MEQTAQTRGQIGVFGLLKQTAKEWSEDQAPRLGAALAYYTVFSIAPLLLIAILIAGLVFSDAQSQIVDQIKNTVGDKAAVMIESMIAAANKPMQSVIATILALGTLFFGAAGVFVQLKAALNTIWDVPESRAGGFWKFVKKYFLSFGMVLGIGFLLLVSLLLETAVAIVGEYLKGRIPGMDVIMQAAGMIVTFGIITLLFALIFKLLPDVKVDWHDVWVGALMTAVLFTIGKLGLGIYLGKASVASAYGAAGSLVVMLLWVYYSAQILFFGAEFTQVYSQHHGSRNAEHCEKMAKRTPKGRLVAEIEQSRRDLAKSVKKFEMFGIGNPEPIRKTKSRFKI